MSNDRKTLERILCGKIEQSADRTAPGTNTVAGVEFVYYEDYETSGAASQFHTLLDSAGIQGRHLMVSDGQSVLLSECNVDLG